MSSLPPTHPRFQRFVREHEDADVTRLLLGRAPEGIDLRAAADQILARRKARTKLPDWYAAEDIVYPPPRSVEQASSRVAADYKASLLSGTYLVDLTGGMGVDTLALADRFDAITYVEPDARLCECFSHNAVRLCDRPIQVVQASAQEFLATFSGRATFFVDPARRDDARRGMFRFQDCSPDVTTLVPLLRDRAEGLLVKASPMLDLSEGVRRLEGVCAVHVVSVGNECKELLLLADFIHAGEPWVHCVDLASAAAPLCFRPSGERDAPVTYGDAEHYLYDPNVAIRKAGAFRTVAAVHGLAKLAPSTHLYTSDTLLTDFPGRVFETLGDAGPKPRRLLGTGKANVISRNHPLSADKLRGKHRLQDGGEEYLIGFRDRTERPRLVIARRVR